MSFSCTLCVSLFSFFFFFFFNDTATTEIYTLSLHDALPTSPPARRTASSRPARCSTVSTSTTSRRCSARSEEHTSELQSHLNLVCRLLLEKKKNNITPPATSTNKQQKKPT